MTTEEMFPPREDKMTHDGQLITAKLVINHYEIKGVPDRRFKTGWRVVPEIGHNTVIEFDIKSNERYQISQK